MKVQLEQLRELLVVNNYIVPVEQLYALGFPPSAAYPAYWYAASAGARLAYRLFPGKPMKVQFYSKIMSVRFVLMTTEQIATHEAAVAQARCTERNKNTYIKEFIARHAGGDE